MDRNTKHGGGRRVFRQDLQDYRITPAREAAKIYKVEIFFWGGIVPDTPFVPVVPTLSHKSRKDKPQRIKRFSGVT